jgi:lipopolysaccharide transport system ATP-binding protein
MIRLENITKRYSLKQYRGRTFREYLMSTFVSGGHVSEHWALRGITLDIPRGESLALIGVNGSGKSTLLRIIAGITHPTAGSVSVDGRVTGVIDLAAGFHGDLTGYENIFLHGTLLGLPRKKIRERLRAIEEFSELEEFLNTPVRQYSWGMLLRLAFSISVHTDPDVFVLDEALAVGDSYFQWKCLRRIQELKSEKKTILFVSHLPDVAEAVCDKAAWISEGSLRAYGKTNDIAEQYQRHLFGEVFDTGPVDFTHRVAALVAQARVGTGEVIIRNVRLLDGEGNVRRAFRKGESVVVELEVHAERRVDPVAVGVSIERAGIGVSLAYSSERGEVTSFEAGTSRVRIVFQNPHLYPGTYYMSVALNPGDDFQRVYDCHMKLYSFTVWEENDSRISARFLDLPCTVTAGSAEALRPERE